MQNFKDEFAGFGPHTVIDMLPMTAADAEAVVAAVGDITPRIVGISSQDVYATYGVLIGTEDGPVNLEPVAESAPLRSELFPYRDRVDADERLYEYDKIPIERIYLSQLGLYGTVLRLPCVYGPNDYQHRMGPYLRRMQDGRSAIFLSEGQAAWRWTRGYVEDIAQGIVVAATSRRSLGRIYNLGEATAYTEREWVEAIGRTVGWQGEIRVLPVEEMPPHLRSNENYAQPLIADTGRIRDELGFDEIVDPEEGLRRTVEWELAHPDERLTDQDFDYAAEDAVL
jgi:nucleoside-diphosphate-sugar epimerase